VTHRQHSTHNFDLHKRPSLPCTPVYVHAQASESARATHQLVAGGRRRLRDVPDDEVAVRRAARQQVRAAGVELQALETVLYGVTYLSEFSSRRAQIQQTLLNQKLSKASATTRLQLMTQLHVLCRV